MKYTELKVSYDKPDVWRRPTSEKVPKVGKTYLRYAKEILDFDTLKEEAYKEISTTVRKNIDDSNSKNELNMHFSEMFEFYSKALIPTDDIDPEFLLKKTNTNTLSKKLQPWCKNLSFNIPTVIAAKPYANLLDKFKGVPAFVCLAGPSLKNNMEQLKAVKGKALIIAVDTSLRPLLEAGVVPDICVTHDANPNGAKFFLSKDHPYNVDNVQLNNMTDEQLGLVYVEMMNDKTRLDFKYDTIGLFVNYCHPLTLLAWNGTAKSFYTVFDPGLPVYGNMAGCCDWKMVDGKYEKEDKGRVVGGSSVGHVAAYVAIALGCNPISFLGLDLSYPGGKTYVEGSSNQKDVSKQKLVEVDSLNGEKVKTNISMLSYKMVFERTLPMVISQTGVKFWNATENADGSPAGILEVGACPRKLSEIIKEYCTKELNFDVLKTLNGGENLDGKLNK